MTVMTYNARSSMEVSAIASANIAIEGASVGVNHAIQGTDNIITLNATAGAPYV